MTSTHRESKKDFNAKSQEDKASQTTSQIGKVVNASPITGGSDKPQIVTAVTKSDAFQKAKAAGEAHDKLLNRQGKKAEDVGRTAIYEALRFAEQFKDGENSIDLSAILKFLAETAGTPLKDGKAVTHGNVTNKWQPVAKAFSHEDALRPIVTKRGYVLAAVIAEKVRSEDLMAEFEKKEDAGPQKGKTGMEKYILMYKNTQRKAKEDEPGSGGASGNPYDDWSKAKLAKSAKNFLAALYKEGLLSEKISRIEDLLAGDALVEAQAS